ITCGQRASASVLVPNYLLVTFATIAAGADSPKVAIPIVDAPVSVAGNVSFPDAERGNAYGTVVRNSKAPVAIFFIDQDFNGSFHGFGRTALAEDLIEIGPNAQIKTSQTAAVTPLNTLLIHNFSASTITASMRLNW